MLLDMIFFTMFRFLEDRLFPIKSDDHNTLCSKSERNAQKIFFGGRGFRTHAALLARRINWSLRPLDHEGQIWIWLDFKYFNTYQKSINFWMAFKAKNGRKWTHQWAWPLLQTSIEPLYPVASLISPNHRIPGFVKFSQPKQGRVTSQNFTENHIFPIILKNFFIFAQWVWGPQLVLYTWIWSKMSNSIMNLHYFLRTFCLKMTLCHVVQIWK